VKNDVGIELLPGHLVGLKKTTETIVTKEGRVVEVWEFVVPTDTAVLDAWALNFRRQYCSDEELPVLIEGTGKTTEQYLTGYVFPDKSAAPGPSIRSGDFAEFLVSDYLEFLRGFWVPRGKYADKASRDESVKGVDILAFQQLDLDKPHADDTLLAFEVKALISGAKYSKQLQKAVDDSAKDFFLRQGETLNATKRRLHRAGMAADVKRIARFQNLTDNPYKYLSGAAAVLAKEAYDITELAETSVVVHKNSSNIELLVVRGSSLMPLVHALYERACK